MTLSPPVRYLLRFLALAYVTVLVVVPVGLILWRTFSPGIGAFFASVGTPAAISALNLSLLVVAIVVPLNVLFGVPTALVLARNRFRGKSASRPGVVAARVGRRRDRRPDPRRTLPAAAVDPGCGPVGRRGGR
ncbi:ABC-type Fe3+ transport system permease subunit [Mycolicibacterium senegalense]|nr:ABC-type Fe3+ transport system permease subunit [Mycolicibacterium senegalense]